MMSSLRVEPSYQNQRLLSFGINNFFSIFKLISLILAIVSTTFLLPISVALASKEYDVIPAFFVPMIITWVIAILFIIFGHKKHFSMSIRSVFGVVSACWVFVIILGAIPFIVSGYIPHIADAFFESASGFTTTGATILSSVETLPISLNLWRCQMHWLGGMGIVALTVALLPLLGVGGFQLIKAETTGPEKGKVTPKITMTAKTLWFIYVGMTILQTILLMAAGMNFVDALAHSFSTLGTGGFSTKNASIGAYNSASIEWICTIFMIMAGINFSLYFYLFSRKWNEITRNSELKVYIGIICIAVILVFIAIIPEYATLPQSLRHAAFQVSSIITTTGFATADYEKWAPLAQMCLFLLMLIGGCSGSTGGGIKVARWVVLCKQMMNEIRRMLHPHGVFSIRLNGRVGRKDIVFSVAAFFFLYLILVFISSIIITINGIDILTAFTATLSMIGNIGPGFGMVGPTENYSFFSDFAKYWLSFIMLAGRLELYTVLIFFIPEYWKK